MSQLYQLSDHTRAAIRQFRLATSRADALQTLVLAIRPRPSYEIVVDNDATEEAAGEVSGLEDLAEVLPDNTPRFVLLAYPLSSDGRQRTALVLLHWKPATVVSQEWKMLYAGATELVRSECAPNKFLEVSSGLEEDADVEDLRSQIEA
ncbi:AGL031Wp [Eremothecium gossypii ATCC 10895]|uniref:AGL031Wp n=1 Tax=Eremothecium gossypii (strain ATCC 10895 / CBS 109.51 / FGSC 9923 / NRRL Y-1056) TaxID=284811 RepID=Q750I2_EREGS|nr:AGL031Wp [Eremothecium gossypii ATCC 10895]AAS54459.1 AGL031Wp [Eremothecium gossypii ATCC 10895]AEY98790.1 FAGL031Wp [Eremothecium gossypii FDAG1]